MFYATLTVDGAYKCYSGYLFNYKILNFITNIYPTPTEPAI